MAYSTQHFQQSLQLHSESFTGWNTYYRSLEVITGHWLAPGAGTPAARFLLLDIWSCENQSGVALGLWAENIAHTHIHAQTHTHIMHKHTHTQGHMHTHTVTVSAVVTMVPDIGTMSLAVSLWPFLYPRLSNLTSAFSSSISQRPGGSKRSVTRTGCLPQQERNI